MTDDLVAFLREQYDEEERGAREALNRTTTTRRWIQGEWVEDTVQPPEWRRSVCPPARVLRDVEAKRRILAQYDRATAALRHAEGPVKDLMDGAVNTYRHVLAVLALPYADHPDYREEWRP